MNKEEIERLRKLIKNIENSEHSVKTSMQNVQSVTLPGTEVKNEFGSFFLIENKYPLNHTHGKIQFNEIFSINKKFLSLIGKDDRFNDIDIKEIAFIDTESTGISGSGTYLFLIGIGYFTETEYILRQYLMRDFNEEEPMLRDIDSFLDNFQAFISFNGKTFDIPNIETRLILSRIIKDIRDYPHLDLLHPARRLWKRRLDAFNLTFLEENLLSFYREDDIPSEQIPMIYFSYIRTKNPYQIRKVIEHNTYDIISMIGILIKECSVISDYFAQPYDIMFNVGRFYENLNQQNVAMEIFTKLFESENICVKEFFIKGSCRLAHLLKKMQLKDDSIEVWEKLISYSSEIGPEPYLELAKFYEHHKRDIPAALKTVKEGIDFCSKNRNYSEYLDDLNNRFERLQTKNSN
ncbi:MAG: ribonuclease H-like domain-containing protein [bacterium]|nr:ribonuclease H-like domain-containing protein [bacterium]